MDNILFNLKTGDSVNINQKNYIVDGLIVFNDNGYKWYEYAISNSGKTYWLNVEIDDIIYISLYEEIHNTAFNKTQNIIYNNISYNLIENGHARVIKSIGNVDTDYGEKVQYYDYADVTDEKFLSIEYWDGEVEYSIGVEIDEKDVNVIRKNPNSASDPNNSYNSYKSAENNNKKPNKGMIYFVLMILFLFIIGVGMYFGINSFSSPEGNVNERLVSYPYFTFKTAITGTYDNNDKANIYVSSMGVNETVSFIETNIGKPYSKDVIEVGKSYCLRYKKYELLIYESDDKETLVQVAEEKYVKRYGHTNLYKGMYISSRMRNYRSNTYSYDGSGQWIKNGSLGSRSTVGGGTSFGK